MTGFTPETEACLACHPSQKDAGTMTPVDEAVERVRGYVESWDGFDDGTIISDELGPNPLTLGDLRALLSALELGRQAQQSPAGLGLHPSALQEPTADSGCVECINCNGSGHRDPHLGPEDPDNGECPLCGGDGMLYTLAALSASTTDSGKVDHYRDDTALKFPTGEGGES